MKLSPRKRFILNVVCGYLIFGSAWIFVTDRLLMDFTDISAVARLSTAKGIAFITLTTLLLILALLAVPDRQTQKTSSGFRTSELMTLADQLPPWIAYVFAATVTLTMLYVRMNITVSSSPRPMLILFMLPIILSSILGGFGPGMTATVIASLGIDYYGIHPLHSLRISDPLDLFQWFMLIMSGLLSSYLSELLHRSRRQSEERRISQEIVQEALNESEKKYRLIAENTADLISILDLNLRFTYVSPASVRLRGFTADEAMVQTLDQVLTPESMKLGLEVFETEMQLEASGTADPDRTRILELEEYTKDGSIIWVEVNLSFLRDQNQKPIGILIVSRDITDRKQAEEALRESEEKFRLTFSFSPDAVNINRLDDGLCIDINEGFTRATGYTREDVIGRTSLELNLWNDPADRQRLVQGLQEKGFYENLEAKFRRKDGSLITALMSARIIMLKGIAHIISITRNITERKMIELKLQQAQKFEAIGTLAGGIAHDFNNLLMGIQGRASLLSMEMDTSHTLREHINAIEEYCQSASNLTRQLLGFAQGGKYEVRPIDMNELVLSSSAMFGRTKKEIKIHTKCEQSPLVVEADKGQIEQVLLNMYVNAWQAMPPEGGELYLETKIVVQEDADNKAHPIPAKRYVKISITDSGVGMDEATRLQIFDPFFTTKEKSRGTGLGLASAYGIIKNHGGTITVYSEIGHGTTFNIYLPSSDKEKYPEISLEQEVIRGTATILLVDDEALIIDVGQTMLEALGYRVIACKGGQEAVKVITDRKDQIDLVILDLIMPGMDGGTTFDRIRQIRPEIPVLLSSGYAINGHANEIMHRGCNGFIQKPYNISELSKKVYHVLNEKNGK